MTQIKNVRDVPEDYTFIPAGSGDALELQSEFGDDYDSFFVKVGEGEYEAVYGMKGAVPHLNKPVQKLEVL